MSEKNYMPPWSDDDRRAFNAARVAYNAARAAGLSALDAEQRGNEAFQGVFESGIEPSDLPVGALRILPFYDELAKRRGDDAELQATVRSTIEKLDRSATSTDRPGVLLGKIQSGKTRAFLGVIAAAFDYGYGGAIVLTKGTKSLALQTLRRVELDFGPYRDRDEVQMFDILNMPPRLSSFELRQRMIIVAKKEDDNLRHLLELFDTTYPSLREQRWLIIDDEADFASLSFRKKDGVVEPGTINRQIEDVRSRLAKATYLEVTATPYSLYLQPEQGLTVNGIPLLKPRKPQFTVVLPTHSEYIGGDYYFEKSLDDNSPASHFYEEVPADERDALRKEDRRRFDISEVLTTSKIAVLRRAIMNFIVGASARRMQQAQEGLPPQKYSFVVHTEQQREAHAWQLRVIDALWTALQAEAVSDGEALSALVKESFQDLEPSVNLAGGTMPDFARVKFEVVRAITEGYLISEKINSENQIESLLDELGQLRLRTPMNLFIGGQILDRGITIRNLIGFYYGRNPQQSQQDTVLQHSRMYGARAKDDLGVTRLYAPLSVYNRMKQIHELDAALRDAFISRAHDRGVYFVETDKTGHIVPCAPNKLLISDVYSLRPGRRILPTGFNTVSLVRGSGRLQRLDELVGRHSAPPHERAVLVPLRAAVEMLELAFANLVFEEPDDGKSLQKAMTAALEWLVRTKPSHEHVDSVWLIAAEDRSVRRLREGGRYSNAPDTKQQHDLADNIGGDIPVLTLMRQNGTESDLWRGLPFWWPIVQVQRNAVTSVYSAN